MLKLALLSLTSFGSALLVWGTAAADAASGSIVLQATVPGICVVGQGRNVLTTEVAFPTDTSGTISMVPQSVTVPSALCNTKASITLSSAQAGARIFGDTAGTDEKVDYIATVSFDGLVTSANTATSSTSAARTTRAKIGILTITVEPIPPIGPMLPSSVYTDTVTVTLSPR